MHYLLIGYMFLFIHRPFEVWPVLGDLRVERVYMLCTMAFWLVAPGKRILPNLQHLAYLGFALAVLLGWALSPYADRGQPQVEDWFKIVVFYVLLVTSVNDERGLRRMAVGFVAVMGVYLLHSLREYVSGRHVYRMGIARMIGVDSTLGDPNSFGASIVFFLPFIPALWRAGVGGRLGRLGLCGVGGLSVLSILLTGSRSSLLGLLLVSLLLVLRVRRAWLWLIVMVALSPAVFIALPESLQTRFETIVNPDVGPANAKESGEGRLLGLTNGMMLWGRYPLTGVGPGAWQAGTGSQIQSHNLYGQLVGELGTLGLLAFVFLLVCFWLNLRRMKAIRKAVPDWSNDLVFQVSGAVGTALVLLLFMGNFGHNLFRFTWLWYGGFLIIARHCVNRRLAELEDDPPADVEEEELPDGWSLHPGHEPTPALMDALPRR